MECFTVEAFFKRFHFVTSILNERKRKGGNGTRASLIVFPPRPIQPNIWTRSVTNFKAKSGIYVIEVYSSSSSCFVKWDFLSPKVFGSAISSLYLEPRAKANPSYLEEA